ncbi:GntR family transcriptional regulator [Gordoniibacillus kamchatkensis]|uniref:GntR family transcriptional regulator n=1 Tax=Gordoniibacillus kamchatkensis TaxID=1590651 RepID=A0ABR5AC87_9BACL|nr:PLP-dependent aminotransferase family protein [Paenibacillus sp. VKM B-2647]KIL38644.1 GntR family transcriptional regulator [Paenibacillus sp. VKM B-2647]
MFDILLPDQDERPLYQQLYAQIRDQIRNGAIADGSRLPSVRALQLQLNMSKTPIETAYQMLTAEGYAVSKPRSGLYVANPYKHASPAAPAAQAQVSPPGTIAPPPRIPASDQRAGCIDFDPTALDPEGFPIRTWHKMLREALENHSGMMGQYGDPQGEYGLRLAVAEYVRNSRGVDCLPEQIVIGSGMAYSIGIVAKLLPDIRRVAFEEPGYSLVRDQFVLNGCEILPIPVGDKGLSLQDLEARPAQIVYVTPSHQFPTGSVMPYPERERLLEWANTRDAYIIEDDYDGEFRYLGKPIPSLHSLDTRGRVIYIGTFSKALTPALRINYMVLPPLLAERLSAMPHEIVYAPSRVEQWAMHAFIEQGHWYRHIRKTRNLYRNKHRHLIALIRTHLGRRVEITGQNAGLHIQLTVKKRQSSEQLVRSAAEAGVKVYDFRKMWMQQELHSADYPKLYLGFAGISPADMETGIRLLRKAWLAD